MSQLYKNDRIIEALIPLYHKLWNVRFETQDEELEEEINAQIDDLYSGLDSMGRKQLEVALSNS